MLFGKKEESDSNEEQYTDYQEVDLPNFKQNITPKMEDESIAPPFIDLKKHSFYSAIQNKKLEDLISELNVWYEAQKKLQKDNIDLRIQFIGTQLQLLQSKLSTENERLDKTEDMEDLLVTERDKTIQELDQLQVRFRELTEELGTAHKDIIAKRLEEVKSELVAITEMYNVVFENKYKDETELKQAVEKQRALCQNMIDSKQEQLDIAKSGLQSDYLFGATHLSAQFKVIIGFSAAFAAAWFFGIFSDANSLESQNWLFFVLNNIFNYLGIYLTKFGPFLGTLVMLMGLVITLGLITLTIGACQSFIHKMTNDKFDTQFGFNLIPKEKSWFNFRVNSSSIFSLWLKILPWLFCIGIVFILLAVGQSQGEATDQIGVLGQRLSGQFIGGSITLLFSGLYLIYHIKVIEPRRQTSVVEEKKEEEEKNGVATDISLRRNPILNKELFILLIAMNALLILISIGQSFDGLIENRKGLLALISFLVLANITAFILGSGIRQIGLYRSVNKCETRIISLSNYRKALAGSKPIQVWIQEENQFKKHFIDIQKELFDLIRTKNRSLNQLRKVDSRWRFNSKKKEGQSEEFSPIGKLNLSRKKEAQFFLMNFPDLAYQIEELRNEINEKKRILDDIKMKLSLIADGHSDFHTTVKNDISKLKRTHDYLQRQLADIDSEMIIYYDELQNETLKKEADILEGFQLGTWVKQTLIA